jgi:hypothetical protein
LTDAGSRKTSTLRRLANIYAGLSEDQPREHVLSVLSIQLVSNRPIGDNLDQSLRAAKIELDKHPEQLSAAALIASIPTRYHADLDRLRNASGLRSRDFTDFLRVLDLRGGEGSRARQELEITADLSAHVKADLAHHTRTLYDFVRRAGLPEGEPIGIEEVLAALGVPDREHLFPAPAVFQTKPREVVPTPDPTRVIAALHSSSDRRVIAHGNAGVGKTTTMLRLADELADGSVLVAFDCFAGGDYLRPAHARHLPERAILQLCNELAVNCRLPLLIVPPKTPPDLWLELEQRLRAAAATVSAIGAELVIVIDAADNAAWAARKRDDPSFVADIWHLKIPPGAGLVVSSRSGRRESLDAPEGIDEVELTGFDEGASTAYLRMSFPGADDADCAEFHARSQGNPRVQSYVLDLPETTSVEKAVELAHHTPKNIFDDLWSSAVEQARDPQWATDRLADLMCLTPPVSLERLAEVATCSTERVRRFCDALVPGLRMEPQGITMQDEDFERYLEDEKLNEVQRRAANSRLADFFAARQQDPYAALVLAEHLLGAERFGELVELAVEHDPPIAIADPLARLQVYTRRLRLALHSSAAPQDRLAAAKLLVLAARAANSDSAVTEIIRRRPDLALRYGDPSAVAAVWRQDRNLNWQGPVHMRLAALRAREGDDERAEAELRSANAWLRRRNEDDNRWDIEQADLAAAVEAIYLLRGIDAAWAAIFRWRPWEFVWKVAEHFIRRLARNTSTEEVADLIFEARLPAQIKARLLVELRTHWKQLPLKKLLAVARAMTRASIRPEHSSGSWPADFVEMVAIASGDRRLVLRLLKRKSLKPQLPSRAPNRLEGVGNFRDCLRWAALRAACEGTPLDIEAVMPASTKDKDADRASSERRNMSESVGPMVEIYGQRAVAFFARPRASNAGRRLRRHVEAIQESSKARSFEPSHHFGAWVLPMSDILRAARGSDPGLVEMAADAAESASGEGDLWTWANMARRLVGDRRYEAQALRLIDRAARQAVERAQPASELADFLLDLVEIADPHDSELAADLYSQAVTAAEGLDERGVGALETHATVAGRLRGHDKAPILGQRIAAALVAYTSRVSEDSYLPWKKTLEAIADMHPPTGFAVAASWEDRRVTRLEESVGWVTSAAVTAGFIPPHDGLSLLFLNGEGGARTQASLALLDQLVAEGDRAELAAGLEHVSLIARRDMRGRARVEGCEALKQWAAQNGLEAAEAVRALDPYSTAEKDQEEAPNSRPRRRDTDDSKLETLIDQAGRCPPEELAEQLGQVFQLSYGDDALLTFLSKAVAGRQLNRRLAVLEALGALPTDHAAMRFHGETILTFLDRVLAEWSSAARVRNWRTQKLRAFLGAQLPNFVRYPESAAKQLAAVARLIGDSASAELAIEGAALNLDFLGPEALHTLAANVGSTLSRDEVVEFLDWSLHLLDLEGDSTNPIASEAPVDVLAGFLWAQFANPEKQIRWRAAHAARRMIASGKSGEELASALLKRAATRDGGDFAAPELDFLWISAQIWVYMTFARVADDNPAVLVGEQAAIREAALSTSWPHAVVRELARRASLRIAAFTGSTKAEREALDLVSRPTSSFNPRGGLYDPLPSNEHDSARWSFDMDTESYWFESMGRVFRFGTQDVARRAERWLIDVLGETPVRDSWRRDPRIAERDYGEIHLHHGSIPRLENASLALEYASMHLVAGELVDQGRPSVVEDYEPVVDAWQEWLSRHLDVRAESWVVDLRSPTPPEAEFLAVQLENRRWPKVTDDHLRVLLGNPGAQHLVVDAYINYNSEAGWGSESVHSALVEPATAVSLVRAMETAEHVSFFPLPLAEENDDKHGNAIDYPPFRLLGWLSEHDRHPEGMDTHDHLARISAGCVLPGAAFIAHHGGEHCPRTHRVLGSDGEALAWVRAFSDRPPAERERYETGFSAEGHQTFVQTGALLDYLRSTGMALVIKVEARRRNESRREPDRENEQEIQRVLLIHPDGTIEGLRGTRSLR